jgi:uncharacterized membrane protein YphA (DoxX/SURF4 family)
MDVPRWLALAGPGNGAREEEGWRLNLSAFRRLVFVHMIVRNFLLLPDVGAPETLVTPLRWAAIVVGLAGFLPGFGVWAARIACFLIVGEVVRVLPEGTNHVAVELALLFFLGLLDERDEQEGRLLLPSVRWFVAIFFFYTGVQKLLYGYYTQGQYLAFAAGTEDRFAALFRWFLPGAELERLQSYNEVVQSTGEPLQIRPGVMRPRIGAGPYIVDSMLFKVLSNLVYVFEITAGAALLVPRLRRWAALSIMVFVVFIELGARELTFGLLMMSLLLLFLEGSWIRRVFWVVVAGYGALILHDLLGWEEIFWYSPA